MKVASRLIAALGLLALSSVALASARLVATDAWIPQAPPGAAMLAGYLTLKNEGDSTARLLAVQSDRFQSATVHRTVIENGVARMRELNHLEIAPGEEVRFAPGGIHVMLMQPRREVVPGEHIEMTFLFSDGQRLRAIFEVQAAETEVDQAHHHEN
jgi:copper(I)-binding protein